MPRHAQFCVIPSTPSQGAPWCTLLAITCGLELRDRRSLLHKPDMPNRISPSGSPIRSVLLDSNTRVAPDAVSELARPLTGEHALQGLAPRLEPAFGRAVGAIPPRQAILHWPNGDVSLGRVDGNLDTGLSFMASSTAGPLAERCRKPSMTHLRHSGASVRPLEVTPILGSAMSELLAVQARLKKIDVPFDGQTLPHLAQVASGTRTGATGVADRCHR